MLHLNSEVVRVLSRITFDHHKSLIEKQKVTSDLRPLISDLRPLFPDPSPADAPSP
jgi:hypothetical protein